MTIVVILFGIFLGMKIGNLNNIVNDRKITVTRIGDIAKKRKRLIRFIWGENGFPADRYPVEVQEIIESPIPNLDNLERLVRLRIEMEGGVESVAWHFIPAKNNNRLVVVHQGHNCTLNDSSVAGNLDMGTARTINLLLSQGYGVLGVYMPHQMPDDCWAGSHDCMFDDFTGTGSPLKYFLEPTAISLNYLKREYLYKEISMLGLSGGGWTTTVYAAIDPTIRFSIPVAGSIPLYLRYTGYNHDKEQYLPAFYRIAGYPDLYVLGSYGPGRRQIQILNRYDNCCFGENQHIPDLVGMPWEAAVRVYEYDVQFALRNIGSGSFYLYIDDTATCHMISDHALKIIILPILDGQDIPVLNTSSELDE